MPEREDIINILNQFIASYEFVDESFCEAFEIQNFDTKDEIENRTSEYIADHLMQGNYLNNIIEFDQKMHTQMLITIQNDNCESLEEVDALQTCFQNLRTLAQ